MDEAVAPYVAKHYHFLAMRVRPEVVSCAVTLAPHPISYTYQALSLVYPMIISRVSAAAENEIVLYVLAAERYACLNWSNAALDDVRGIEQARGGGTTYEPAFRKMAGKDGHLFVTEFAGNLDTAGYTALLADLLRGDPQRFDVAVGDSRKLYLTRLHALIRPAAMDRDVELVPMAAWHDIDNSREVGLGASESGESSGGVVAAVGMAAAACAMMTRRARRGRSLLAVGAGVALIVAAAALGML